VHDGRRPTCVIEVGQLRKFGVGYDVGANSKQTALGGAHTPAPLHIEIGTVLLPVSSTYTGLDFPRTVPFTGFPDLTFTFHITRLLNYQRSAGALTITLILYFPKFNELFSASYNS